MVKVFRIKEETTHELQNLSLYNFGMDLSRFTIRYIYQQPEYFIIKSNTSNSKHMFNKIQNICLQYQPLYKNLETLLLGLKTKHFTSTIFAFSSIGCNIACLDAQQFGYTSQHAMIFLFDLRGSITTL